MKLQHKPAEGYIDIIVVIIAGILVLALAVSIFPVYIAKSQLDSYAHELCRTAEITGNIGTETSGREIVLNERLGIHPQVEWSKTGKVQLNEEFTVTVSLTYDIGFGGLGSFPVELVARATGKSEVYHK